MNSHNNYLFILTALFAVVWLALAIEPYDRHDWLLENGLVFVFVLVSVYPIAYSDFSGEVFMECQGATGSGLLEGEHKKVRLRHSFNNQFRSTSEAEALIVGRISRKHTASCTQYLCNDIPSRTSDFSIPFLCTVSYTDVPHELLS